MARRCTLLLLLLLLLLLALAACGADADPTSGGLSIVDVLGGGAGDPTGFERATAPPELQFPRDHGAHPGFRTEWWYITGNVDSTKGRRFGVELVFFRQALAPTAPVRAASLAARDLILAHAAVPTSMASASTTRNASRGSRVASRSSRDPPPRCRSIPGIRSRVVPKVEAAQEAVHGHRRRRVDRELLGGWREVRRGSCGGFRAVRDAVCPTYPLA